ncbi:MAG: Xaa-Pro peptidase family protein [Candidatus Azobacteroides sp.]|nr:Xaa-Pro peptidase family protein [Candidatus Azobacteroides sp.]
MLSSELEFRRNNIRQEMIKEGYEASLFSTNVNLFYLCGQIISGYLYIPSQGTPLLFIKRPVGIEGENIFYIRKPEQIKEILSKKGLKIPENIMLETSDLPYNDIMRLQKIFNPKQIGDATMLARKVRSIKTVYEIEQFRLSAKKHAEVYAKIPSLYKPGMTEIDLSIEIEYEMRKEGSIGVFRAFGQSMEIFVGSVLAGENAGAPSPFDFALGGQGIHPAIPIGGNNTRLKEGMAVMVDIGGTFTGYITDMTRTYSVGKLTEEAYKAHQVSIEIHDAVRNIAKPGVICEDIYNLGMEIVARHNLSDKFMGTSQQAKFIGHGIGIEINELPVLAPRFKTPLQENMVFALEPKFVLPEIGAVGIENSYVVTENGIETLTKFAEEIISLK